jgi:2-amino-4-ketopentanoate thiolase alpha subunit
MGRPSSTIPAGSWVEVRQIVLPAGQRSPGVPSDTSQVDFVARVRGFLVEPAALGAEASVRTLIGREVRGFLAEVNPRNPADFGNPIPELLQLGADARSLLERASDP